jgi:hypothetical protein
MSAARTAFAFALLLPIASANAAAGEGTPYGEPLSGVEKTEIPTLVAQPDDYVGKTVCVEGVVTAVCEKRGCWMTLTPDDASTEVRIKVDDGVIVFPLEAKGRRAVAEGVFTKHELTLEQTVAYKKHHAEEQGEEFNPASVTEPMTYYQVKATGAVVY